MRSSIAIDLIVVALCACIAAAERPEQLSPGDAPTVATGEPNETWDPSEYLSADWESITLSMTSRLYNPASQRSTDTDGPRWSLSIVSTAYLAEGSHLVGWSWLPASVLALDSQGRLVASSTTYDEAARWYTQPASRRPGIRAENRVSLNLPIDPDAAHPDLLGRVEWTLNVLVAEEVETVDVPFQTTDAWVELTAGMEVRVEQAVVGQETYQYRLQARYAPNLMDFLADGSFRSYRGNTPSEVVVLKMELLDTEGEPISTSDSRAFGKSIDYSEADDQMLVTVIGNGACQACGAAAMIRFKLAFNLDEQGIRFVFEDIPVPIF